MSRFLICLHNISKTGEGMEDLFSIRLFQIYYCKQNNFCNIFMNVLALQQPENSRHQICKCNVIWMHIIPYRKEHFHKVMWNILLRSIECKIFACILSKKKNSKGFGIILLWMFIELIPNLTVKVIQICTLLDCFIHVLCFFQSSPSFPWFKWSWSDR